MNHSEKPPKVYEFLNEMFEMEKMRKIAFRLEIDCIQLII